MKNVEMGDRKEFEERAAEYAAAVAEKLVVRAMVFYDSGGLDTSPFSEGGDHLCIFVAMTSALMDQAAENYEMAHRTNRSRAVNNLRKF